MTVLAEAERAIEEYDYDRARELLDDATASSPADISTVILALRLRVELMYDDPGALALAARLPPTALDDPEVMGLIGLAAARQGQHVQARRLLMGATPRLAREAWAAIGHHQLDAGRADEAGVSLGFARDIHGEPSPEVERLVERIREFRARDQADAEAVILTDLVGLPSDVQIARPFLRPPQATHG